MDRSRISLMSTPQDAEAVRHLILRFVAWLIETYPQHAEDTHSYYSPERIQAALDEIPDGFTHPRGLALIARLDDAPVGCVLARPFQPGVAEMKRLFVLPSARGQGLGAGLVRALIEQMDAQSFPTIRLDTATFLTEAIALYRHLGFVRIEPYTTVPPGAAGLAIFMERRP